MTQPPEMTQPPAMTPEPFDRQPILVGDRVQLRPMQATDRDPLYALARDPMLWASHPAHDRWQEPVFERMFQAGLASGGALVAQLRPTGALIGSSRFGAVDLVASRAEIGWTWLARSHWGQGWNGAIKRLMLDHAFRRVATVFFRIAESNQRSRRAMEKLGGKISGIEDVFMPDGACVPHLIYQISRPASLPAP
jgi:RimJ/RimL family protein N-acetyltransferase